MACKFSGFFEQRKQDSREIEFLPWPSFTEQGRASEMLMQPKARIWQISSSHSRKKI